jgi:hypothetical protein
MFYEIKLSEGGHEWEKQNLVTVMLKRGGHDVLKCKHCGIQGKTTSLWTISLKGSYLYDKVYNCVGIPKVTKIQITICTAFGNVFANLTPGSIHNVIGPPDAYKNDKGTWVMGVGEPVKVLPHEFKILN